MHGGYGTILADHARTLLSSLTDAEIVARMMLSRAPRVSKHRQYDKQGNHIRGKCIIADNSSIRKRMRAWRREAVAA